jgi:hypothetical protein
MPATQVVPEHAVPFTHASATHDCGVLGNPESGLHRRSPVLQAAHMWLVVLQTGVVPLQAVLPTQLPLASQVCGVSELVPPHRVLLGTQATQV